MSGSFRELAIRLSGETALLWGWRPDEFWSATPAEVANIVTAMNGGSSGTPPDREQLAELMKEFPDG